MGDEILTLETDQAIILEADETKNRVTPLQAVRQHCLWCCNGSANEVRLRVAKSVGFGRFDRDTGRRTSSRPRLPIGFCIRPSATSRARHSMLVARGGGLRIERYKPHPFAGLPVQEGTRHTGCGIMQC
jgi:hypothetical protein